MIAVGIAVLISAIHLTKGGFVSNCSCQEQLSCAFPNSNFLEICLIKKSTQKIKQQRLLCYRA
ncbi:hypothetical protein [Candidatus Cardinium hertigii]|nr:hypothetical protein [Candidatus Cardinium hertigii]